MKDIYSSVDSLKDGKIGKIVAKRMIEFRDAGKKSSKEVFKELCFCLLTANYDAEKAIRIQKAVDDGFLELSEGDLAKKLRKLGYRFPNIRAKFIAEARKHKDSLKKTIQSHKTDKSLREWLVENVKGLGLKESSHFLRNIGYANCAIIDFHIVDILVANKLIKKPKTLTEKAYLTIEKTLKKMADKLNLNLAELDLYLWYLETGKILK